MNALTVRKLINEEINRNIRIEMVLTKDEIYAMRRLEMRAYSLNEGLDWGIVKDMTIAALKTRTGRRLAIGLLKALHSVLDAPNIVMKEITIPMWQRAIDFLRSKGLKVPFDAVNIYEFMRYTPPFMFILAKPVEWAIDFLKELNDDQYLEMIGQKDEKPSEKERNDQRRLPDNNSPMSLGANDPDDREDTPRPLSRARRRMRN